MAALHLDNLLFLLFVALAIFFQILTRAVSKSRRRPGDTRPRSASSSQTSRPLSRESDETDEERIRKFLEALGQPTTSKPPAPVAPRPTYRKPVVLPHVGPFGSPLPPLTTRPPESERDWQLRREIKLPGQITPTREARIFRPKVADASVFEAEVGAAFQPTAPQSSTKTYDVATLLRSASGLRDAIILREIFGPPRSLQPLDLVGGV